MNQADKLVPQADHRLQPPAHGAEELKHILVPGAIHCRGPDDGDREPVQKPVTFLFGLPLALSIRRSGCGVTSSLSVCGGARTDCRLTADVNESLQRSFCDRAALQNITCSIRISAVVALLGLCFCYSG